MDKTNAELKHEIEIDNALSHLTTIASISPLQGSGFRLRDVGGHLTTVKDEIGRLRRAVKDEKEKASRLRGRLRRAGRGKRLLFAAPTSDDGLWTSRFDSRKDALEVTKWPSLAGRKVVIAKIEAEFTTEPRLVVQPPLAKPIRL